MALLIRESVAWQKKYNKSTDLANEFYSSLAIPQSNIILPFPGSPLIHSNQL